MYSLGVGSQNTFWLIASLIFNGFSIRKKFWKAETKAYSMAPSDSAYLVADIVLSWFMLWFKGINLLDVTTRIDRVFPV